MLKRKKDVFLQEWKNREHNPLIIKGARQIGKTTSIMEFAKKNYESVIEINFVSNPEYIQIFKGGFDVDSIILELSILNPNLKFIPNNTLLSSKLHISKPINNITNGMINETTLNNISYPPFLKLLILFI